MPLLLGCLLLQAPPVTGQEKAVQLEECTGPYKGGQRPSQEHLAKILHAHKEWLDRQGEKTPRGQRANLCGVHLFKANLQGANLSGANLQEARLFVANLQGANLNGADLQGADLTDADV